MNLRSLAPTGALTYTCLLGLLVPATAQAQESDWTPGRTAWGDPDLQGVYTFSTQTPLERPEGLGNKETYTEEELAELERQAAQRIATDEVNVAAGEVPA